MRKLSFYNLSFIIQNILYIGDCMNNIAFANIRGNDKYYNLYGIVYFYPYKNGTVVEIEVFNMPKDSTYPYALHIHEGGICNKNDFSKALDHYNPKDTYHPAHSGDLPPLFSNNGYSYMKVFTDRFTPDEIKGRTIIIHEGYDDFISQPSGSSGPRIACGVIK